MFKLCMFVIFCPDLRASSRASWTASCACSPCWPVQWSLGAPSHAIEGWPCLQVQKPRCHFWLWRIHWRWLPLSHGRSSRSTRCTSSMAWNCIATIAGEAFAMGGMSTPPRLHPKLLDGTTSPCTIRFWILKRIAGPIYAARKRAALLIHQSGVPGLFSWFEVCWFINQVFSS